MSFLLVSCFIPGPSGSNGQSIGKSKSENTKIIGFLALTGGRGGIRTHGTLAGTPVFKTGALNHSATLPTFENIGLFHVLRRTKRERLAPITTALLPNVVALVYGGAEHPVNRRRSAFLHIRHQVL